MGLNDGNDVGQRECPVHDEVQSLAGPGQALDESGGVGLALTVNELAAAGPLRVQAGVRCADSKARPRCSRRGSGALAGHPERRKGWFQGLAWET